MDIVKNSATLKIKLLLNGIRIDESAFWGLGKEYKEYQYGYNDSNWIKQEKRALIPSELLLPGNIVVAPHLRPSSPYLIKRIGEDMKIIDERSQNILSSISYLPRPKIWDLKMSDGSSVKEYLNIYGSNCLNLFIVANCDFWEKGIPCVFCSLQPTQKKHSEVVVNKSLDKIEEAVRLAFENEDNIDWMIITGGSLTNRKNEIKRYYDVLRTIKKHIPTRWNGKIRGNAALLPTNDEKDLEDLYSTGI